MCRLLVSVVLAGLLAGSLGASSAHAQLLRRNRVYSYAYPSYYYPAPNTTYVPAVPADTTGYNSYYPGGAEYEPQFHGSNPYPLMFFGPASGSYYPGGAEYEPQYFYNYPSYHLGW